MTAIKVLYETAVVNTCNISQVMEKGALSRLQTGFSTGQLVFYLKQLMYMIFHKYRTLIIRVVIHFHFLSKLTSIVMPSC